MECPRCSSRSFRNSWHKNYGAACTKCGLLGTIDLYDSGIRFIPEKIPPPSGWNIETSSDAFMRVFDIPDIRDGSAVCHAVRQAVQSSALFDSLFRSQTSLHVNKSWWDHNSDIGWGNWDYRSGIGECTTHSTKNCKPLTNVTYQEFLESAKMHKKNSTDPITTKDLISLKNSIQSLQQKKDRLIGSMDSLKKTLVESFKVKTVKEARIKLKEMRKQIKEIQARVNSLNEEMEREMNERIPE